MPPFTVNPARLDPYRNFNFRLIWEGRVVSVSKVSALRRTTEVVAFRSGSEPSLLHKAPGLTRFEPITIERGVTHDTEFEDWVRRVWDIEQSAKGDFRKDIRLEMLNEAGQVALAYVIFRCWPSSYQALPELDASANAIAVEQLVLENEGWMRDRSIPEPLEP